jgi:ABC-type Fe3+ transport system substrate-binding protein
MRFALDMRVSAVAVLALLLSASAPCLAESVTAALQAVIDGARKEGRLDINNGPGVMGLPNGLEQAKAGIRKQFGLDIDVQWSPSPSPSAQITKLYTEFRAGVDASTDILTIAAPAAAPYVGKGLFRKIAWTDMMPDRVTKEIVEGDGEALRMSTQLPGLLYNIKQAPWAPAINNMDDLLNPSLKGKFASNPFLAGIDIMLSPELWGVEKTTDYVRKFSSQISGLVRCGDAQERVATGEFPALALDCVGGDQNMIKFRGKGLLDTKILADTAQRRYLFMVLPARARHPNAAILYALYMLSPEGQKLILDNDGADLDTFPDSGNSKRVHDYEARGVHFTDVTIAWWAKQPAASMSAIGDMAKIAAHEK